MGIRFANGTSCFFFFCCEAAWVGGAPGGWGGPFPANRPYGPHLTSCARTLRPTRAITPTLCAQKAPGLHAQLPKFFMYVKHARPTCTIAPIIDVGEKCPAYMQAAPEPPFCILLVKLFNIKPLKLTSQDSDLVHIQV